MPVPTFRVLRVPKDRYLQMKTLKTCTTRTGVDYSLQVGRQWTGNQRRPRGKFNPPTMCQSRTFRGNLTTVRQGVASCETKPAFALSGPSWVEKYGDSSSNGKNELRVRNIALARFSSNTGLGVTLAETAGTLRSLGDRLYAVTRILKSLRKGDMRQALSVLHQHTGYNTARARARLDANPGRNYTDRAANFWLETTFGWVPLLQSIYDTLSELGEDRTTRRRSRASDSFNGVRAGVTAEFKTSDGNRFSRLGITNPAEVAWDLVPFSFVIDWFVPIGDSIRYLGVRPLTTQIWMWSTRKWGVAYYNAGYLGSPPGTFTHGSDSYARSVAVPSVGTFTARLPATMWHAVTSAALIQGLRPR